MINLTKDFRVVRIARTGCTGITRRNNSAGENFYIGRTRLRYGLFYGGTLGTVARNRTGSNRTELPSGERVLAHLLDDLIVVNGRKISFLDFGDKVFVKDEHEVVYRVGTQVAVIVVIARIIFKTRNNLCDTFGNRLTFYSRCRFARCITDCSRYIDFYVFRSNRRLRRADKRYQS